MLKLFVLGLLKPYLNIVFFIVAIGILILIYSELYLYVKDKKKKIPLPVTILSGFTLFLGAANILLVFVLRETAASLPYLFLIKVAMFFFGMILLYLGVAFLQAKNWARIFFFWLLAIIAVGDVILTITSNNFKYIMADIGIYAVTLTVYYFGLEKKYFKKEGEDFTLQEDAAIKKKQESYFDWLNE